MVQINMRVVPLPRSAFPTHRDAMASPTAPTERMKIIAVSTKSQ